MSHKIDMEKCIKCSSCQGECMENAISYTNDKFIIDPKKCTDCGSCADICPAQAINKEE